MNVFKLAENKAGIMVSSEQAILKNVAKRGHLTGWMIATVGMTIAPGTSDSKDEMKNYRSIARMTWICHSSTGSLKYK